MYNILGFFFPPGTSVQLAKNMSDAFLVGFGSATNWLCELLLSFFFLHNDSIKEQSKNTSIPKLSALIQKFVGTIKYPLCYTK